MTCLPEPRSDEFLGRIQYNNHYNHNHIVNFQSACIMLSFGIMSIISTRPRAFIPSFRLSGRPRTDGRTVTQQAAKEEQISV